MEFGHVGRLAIVSGVFNVQYFKCVFVDLKRRLEFWKTEYLNKIE